MQKIIKLVTNEYLPKELPHGGILMNDGEDIDFTNFAVEPEPCPECPEGSSYVYVPALDWDVFSVNREHYIDSLDAAILALKATSFIQVMNTPQPGSVDSSSDLDYLEISNDLRFSRYAYNTFHYTFAHDLSPSEIDYLDNGATVLKFDKEMAIINNLDWYDSIEEALYSDAPKNMFSVDPDEAM